MKYLIGFLITLSSCAGDGLKTEKTNNTEFDCTLLFEYNGIKVYRFYDFGRYHYFTSKDETISTHISAYHTGKMSIIHKYDENISSGR